MDRRAFIKVGTLLPFFPSRLANMEEDDTIKETLPIFSNSEFEVNLKSLESLSEMIKIHFETKYPEYTINIIVQDEDKTAFNMVHILCPNKETFSFYKNKYGYSNRRLEMSYSKRNDEVNYWFKTTFPYDGVAYLDDRRVLMAEF